MNKQKGGKASVSYEEDHPGEAVPCETHASEEVCEVLLREATLIEEDTVRAAAGTADSVAKILLLFQTEKDAVGNSTTTQPTEESLNWSLHFRLKV